MPRNSEINSILSDIGKDWKEIYIHNLSLLKRYLGLNMTGNFPRSGDMNIDTSKEYAGKMSRNEAASNDIA